jgi:hypothetical protein
VAFGEKPLAMASAAEGGDGVAAGELVVRVDRVLEPVHTDGRARHDQYDGDHGRRRVPVTTGPQFTRRYPR